MNKMNFFQAWIHKKNQLLLSKLNLKQSFVKIEWKLIRVIMG